MAKIAIFDIFDFWILAKMFEKGLNKAKMAKNELCFDFEKKNFKKFHKFFDIFLPKPCLKMGWNGPKPALFWFLEKKFRKIFENFSSFLYQNHTQNLQKWSKKGQNEVCFDFWKNFSQKISRKFLKFFSIFMSKPWLKRPKMG